MNESELREIFLWPSATSVDSPHRTGSYKDDPLLGCIERLVSQQKAYRPTIGATRRTEPPAKVRRWINGQNRHERRVRQALNLPLSGPSLHEADFPIFGGEDKCTITISPNILYLLDAAEDFQACFEGAFPARRIPLGDLLDMSLGVLLFLTSSLESGGRAFKGDPFSGQVAAFAKIFATDIDNEKVHNFVTYYPHQLYSQFFSSGGKPLSNKGMQVLERLADLVITNDGVVLHPSEEWRLYL